ncbi:MAG: FHA domain-containing protein [bacterium]|nr:FHA domain-containing protein [bacterium]
MGKYLIEQNSNGMEVYYEPYFGEQLCLQEVEQIGSSHIEGIAPMEIMEREGTQVVRYMIGTKKPLEALGNNGMSEAEVLNMFIQIMEMILQTEALGIGVSNLLLDKKCIFIDKKTKECSVLFHCSDCKTGLPGIEVFIKSVLESIQINYNQYNVTKYIEQYLEENKQINVIDFKEYMVNMKNQLFEQKYYSGQQSLSCRLGDKSIQIEELLEIAAPTLATAKMMEEETVVHKAYLVRCASNEQILITKSMFTLGSDETKVDYVIKGNGAISRVHAMILIREGNYFIKDLDSTNHTFVNRILVKGAKEMDLLPGCSVILGNEAFVFYYEEEQKNEDLLF